MEKNYKSRIIAILLLLITTTAFAQIPNPGFETWSSGSCDLGIYSYDDPNGWGTINSLTCPGGGFTCLKATGGANVHNGHAALELTTVSIFGQTAPGICATGTINQNTQAVQGGFAQSVRPDKLIGWYKYAPSPPDTFSIAINVFSGATTGTIIGSGVLSGSTAVSNWTKFIVNIPYTSGLPSDSAQITILNSAGANGQPGTTMYVDSVQLISCAGFAATAQVVNATCTTATGSVTLGNPVNGTAPFAYNWTNGSTATSITNVSPGTYKVTITDANTCVTIDSVVVSSTNVPFTASVTGSTTSCTSNTGTVTANASAGNSPYTYLWANSSTAAQLTGLGAGNYPVTISDAHGCTSTASGSVTTPNGPTATDAVTNVNCFNDSTGSVSVNVSGGTSPVTYTWSNGSTSVNLLSVAAGTYTLTISDHNNCSFEVSATVSQPSALSLLLSNMVNPVCNGNNTGQVSVNVTGGTTPYTYAWTNGTTIAALTGLTAGNYSVTVTDSNFCTATITDTIIQPAAVTALVNVVNASSANASNGLAYVNASGGTGQLTYTWVTGSSHDTISHLSPGTYCVTVTDINNCSATACDSVGFSVGINTIPSALIRIYPNPANSQLTIETGLADKTFQFNIFSLDGRLVQQAIISDQKSMVQLNGFAEGFYTYQLKDITSGAINYGKLEIQR